MADAESMSQEIKRLKAENEHLKKIVDVGINERAKLKEERDRANKRARRHEIRAEELQREADDIGRHAAKIEAQNKRRLRKERDRYREALEDILDEEVSGALTNWFIERARKALEGHDG